MSLTKRRTPPYQTEHFYVVSLGFPFRRGQGIDYDYILMKGICTACEKKVEHNQVYKITCVSPFPWILKNNLLTIFRATVFIPLGGGMSGLALCHNFFTLFQLLCEHFLSAPD